MVSRVGVGVLSMVVSCTPCFADASDEVRSIVAEMLADAGTRSSLVGSGASVTHEGGFLLSADSGETLRVGGIVQFRYFRGLGADDDEGGFQNRRSRLDFRGTLASPDFSYRLRWDFSPSTGRAALLDVFVQHAFAEGWSWRAGQFTVPFDREFFTAPSQLLLIDRSIVSSVFRVNRSQGVMLAYRGDRLRAYGTIDDGRAGLNTDFLGANVADIGLTGRLEFRLGDAPWSQYASQSGRPGDATGAMLGVAGHYQHEGQTGAPADVDGEVDLYLYTADVSVEGDGWSVIAALAGRDFEGERGSAHDIGAFAHAGRFVTDDVEVYGRYAHVFPGERDAGGDADFGQATLGCNWYPLSGSTALRLSAEVTYFTRSASSFASILRTPDTTLGLLPDDDGGQLSVALQAQIRF
ncbi:MAG: hypothetical protein Tsb0013_06510 [Phycisphaerales bacterium]